MPSRLFLTEAAILNKVIQLGFPPFAIRMVCQPILPSGDRPDAEVELSWEGRSKTFLVECKSIGTPRQLDGAIAQAQRYANQMRDTYPMIVVPYLSPSAVAQLRSTRVSGIDLSGNGIIIGPKGWFVERQGQPNTYPSSAPIKNVYRGKSSLVCRALLLYDIFPSVNAVVDTIRERSSLLDEDVTQATVSKVLKVLEEELLIDRQDGIRVTHRGELLDRLVQNYRPPQETQYIHGVISSGGERPAFEYVADAAERLGIRYAADMITDYVPFPGVNEMRMYVQSIAPFLAQNFIQIQERFPTIHLVETRDPTVYFDARHAGVWRVSPTQMYLETAAGSKRDREISDTLRERVLQPMIIPPSSAETPDHA